MEKPIITYYKTAEKKTNKMRIPKVIIENWGNDFYMEIYENHIKLIPIRKEK